MALSEANNPLETQVGGSHYKDLKIQPIEFIHANNIDFISANIIKYAARHKSKNKDEDMKKIIHYALLGLQLIYDYNGEEIKELLKSFANEKV